MVSCFILSANDYQKTNQTFKKLQPTNVRGILLNNKTDNSYLELKKSLIEKYNDILSNKLQSLSCEYKEEIKTILGSDYILYIESLKDVESNIKSKKIAFLNSSEYLDKKDTDLIYEKIINNIGSLYDIACRIRVGSCAVVRQEPGIEGGTGNR